MYVHVAINFLAITSLQRYARVCYSSTNVVLLWQSLCQWSESEPNYISIEFEFRGEDYFFSDTSHWLASGTAVVDAIFSDAIKLTEREPPRERAPRWRHNKNCRPWLADEDQHLACGVRGVPFPASFGSLNML